MSKPRRPLDQQLAREFVFGAAEESTDAVTEKTTEKRAQTTAAGLAEEVVSQFKGVRQRTTRITVDLPQSRHLELAALAKHLGTSINSLGRTLIEKFLDQVDQDLLK